MDYYGNSFPYKEKEIPYRLVVREFFCNFAAGNYTDYIVI